MNQYQKKVLFIVFTIIAIIAIIAVVWSLFISDNEPSPGGEEPGNSNPPGNTEDAFSTSITALNDYDEFFTVSSIINDYYEAVASKDVGTVLDLLDVDYQTQMGIAANNVFQMIKSDYHSATYTPMQIYYNADSVVTYYFVNGYLEDVDITDDRSIYYDQVNFLAIVNKNTRHYAIVPLADNLDIEDYAKSYQLVQKDLEFNTYRVVNTTEESVLITYLNVFRDLLFLDNERAYQMLSDNTKKLYNNWQDFYQYQEEMYDYIPSTVFGFSKKEENGVIIYQITDAQQNLFEIYENKVMDFQISY